jgi:hypothetical protein
MFMDLDFDRNRFPEIEGITRHIYRGRNDTSLYSRTLMGTNWGEPEKIAVLPARYLVVRPGNHTGEGNRDPYTTRLSYAVGIVDGGKEKLIEEYYSATLLAPTWLPIVADGRWSTTQPLWPNYGRKDPLQAFVESALEGARPELVLNLVK